MKEKLITFETAKLAKEKGFIQKEVYPKWRVFNKTIVNLTNGDELYYSAPTQSLLQKWLREKHRIYIEIKNDVSIGSTDVVAHSISIIDNRSENRFYPCWDICGLEYEEALEKGLQEALKLI